MLGKFDFVEESPVSIYSYQPLLIKPVLGPVYMSPVNWACPFGRDDFLRVYIGESCLGTPERIMLCNQ